MLWHANLIPDSGCGIVCFLDTFTKLRIENISCTMSVHPSVHVEQLSSRWIDVIKFDI